MITTQLIIFLIGFSVWLGISLLLKRLEQGVLPIIYPPIVYWYYYKFPHKTFNILMAAIFVSGFILTALGKDASIPTYLFLILLIPVAVLFIVVWYAKRNAENEK